MENKKDLSRELEISKMEKESLGKACELAHAQANSIMLFTLQWKDLEDHLDNTMKSLEEKGNEIGLRQKLLEERERELGLVRSSIEDCKVELKGRERELGLIRSSIEDCKVELEGKETELGLVQKIIEECSCEYETRKGELDVLRKCMLDWTQKLSLKKEELSSVEHLLKKFLGEIKEREQLQNSITEQLELRKSQLSGIENLIEVCKEELTLKQQELNLVQESIEKCTKERTDELFESSPLTIDGRRDLLLGEVTVSHSDPSKFVLDLIRGLYSDNQKDGATNIEEGTMRKYIILLKWLKEFIRKIDPQIKAQAMKLAVDWKSNMRAVAENSLEVLCFLQLLVTYELVTSFNREEILKLLFTVAPLKQAPEICRALGFADMVPDFVQNLIGRNQHLEAIRFICAFKLIDDISLLSIIRQYLDNVRYSAEKISNEGSSLDTKNKKIGLKIDSLRALIECIEDCKLEALIRTQIFQNSIVLLEQEKARWNNYVWASYPMTPQQLQAEYCNFGASSPMFHPQQGEQNSSSSASGPEIPHKRSRTDPLI